jgi:SAM-dependent methyltransferase
MAQAQNPQARNPMDDQHAFWNEVQGPKWVRLHELIEPTLAPIGAATMDRLAPQPGEHVLDVGCGCGQSSLALAERVSANGKVTGIDISAPMLALAQKRADEAGAPITFIQANAETYEFEPDSADCVYSRFGVMFFAEFVTAFTNLLRATKPGGRLALGAWRTRRDNPWAMTAVPIARPHVELPPRPAPGDPGQFAFEDDAFVRDFLERAGWSDITFERFDADLRVGDTVDDAADFLIEMGPVAAPLAAATEDIRTQVGRELREALKDAARPEGVFLGSSSWIIMARKG